jgi:tricorn protease-like protein
MKKLLYVILVFIGMMSMKTNTTVLSMSQMKYNIFYGEIETLGWKDLGNKYFVYNTLDETKTEISDVHLKDGFNGMPVPSGNLKYMVFFSGTEKLQYLNILNLKKSIVEQKVTIPLLSSELAISGNMRHITFCRNPGMYEKDYREIYIYNNKTGSLSRITSNDVPDYNPVFVPSGEAVFYLCQPNLSKTILRKYDIAKAVTEDVKTFSGTGYQLAQCMGNGLALLIKPEKDGIPFWLDMKTGKTKDINLERIYFAKASPDGKKLMYHQARKDDDSTWDLFVSDIDGKNPQMIAKPDNVDIFGVEWVNGK